MEIWVQQELQTITTAPNSRVVKFKLECLEFLKEGGHGLFCEA